MAESSSKGRKLSSELSLQITETEISPKMDKIAISTKKQVLSVRKLRPAHFQVFWWKYSKVTSANPSVLCFVSELHGREEVIYSASVITRDKLPKTLSTKCWHALVSSGLIESSSLEQPILEHYKYTVIVQHTQREEAEVEVFPSRLFNKSD